MSLPKAHIQCLSIMITPSYLKYTILISFVTLDVFYNNFVQYSWCYVVRHDKAWQAVFYSLWLVSCLSSWWDGFTNIKIFQFCDTLSVIENQKERGNFNTRIHILRISYVIVFVECVGRGCIQSKVLDGISVIAPIINIQGAIPMTFYLLCTRWENKK